MPNFHPKDEGENDNCYEELITDLKDIMEREDNFFLIQQIQDRTQILESKRKQYNDTKQKLAKEIKQLEKMEEDIDMNLTKAEFETKLLGSQGVSDSFGDVDIDEVSHILE